VLDSGSLTDEPDSDASDSARPVGEDVVVLGSQSTDGKSVPVVRLRDGQVELGKVQALEEGKPIAGEVVKLTPRQESPRVCDVEVQYRPPSARRAARREEGPARERGGPPQVATDEYRKNWDVIWARPKKGALPS